MSCRDGVVIADLFSSPNDAAMEEPACGAGPEHGAMNRRDELRSRIPPADMRAFVRHHSFEFGRIPPVRQSSGNSTAERRTPMVTGDATRPDSRTSNRSGDGLAGSAEDARLITEADE